MSAQLSLDVPARRRPTPPPDLIPIFRDRRDPYEPFDAEGCLEMLLEAGASGEWLDWFDICDFTKMYPSTVSNLCTALARSGTLVHEDRHYCNDRLLAPDGYVTAAKDVDELRRRKIYLGFCTTYRLAIREPRAFE